MEFSVDSSAQNTISRIAASTDGRLVWGFFILFSRFEYALERGGFLKTTRLVAEADWERFGRTSQDAFARVDTESVAAAIQPSPQAFGCNGGFDPRPQPCIGGLTHDH